MTVDADRFEKLVERLEGVSAGLQSVASDMRVLTERLLLTSNAVTKLENEIAEERKERLKLRADLDKWVNRGWGVWGALAAAFAIVTAIDWARVPVQMAPPAYNGTKAPEYQNSTGK
jgi:hypothetical protein